MCFIIAQLGCALTLSKVLQSLLEIPFNFIHVPYLIMSFCLLYTVKSCAIAPNVAGATIVDSSPYFFGEELTVTCDMGHESTDNCTAYVTRCLATKMWSKEDDCTSKKIYIIHNYTLCPNPTKEISD